MLVPVKVEAPLRPPSKTLNSGSLPSHEREAGQSSTRVQHTELERGEFGTVVSEVAVITTTITTHKRYRVEDA